MSKKNPLLLGSLQSKLQQLSLQSSNGKLSKRGINLFGKNIQRCWFNLCTFIDNHLILDKKYYFYFQMLFLFISIILLNFFVTTFLTKLAAQLTVGFGGNIMYWHHPYITPDTDSSADKQIKIPKIIHQTYKSFDSIPLRWENSAKSWKKYHPDWKYMFWSDDDIDAFMNEYYSWFAPFYYSYPHQIQRVDVARYFILYHFGGIYCDLDIAPKHNIESLLADIEIFLVETPNLGTTNSLFGSVKKSNFLFYVIDNLPQYYDTGYYQFFFPKHLKILSSTGSTAFWALYGKYCTKNIAANEKFGILHNKYFGRLAVCYPNRQNDDRSSVDSTFFGCNMASFEQSYFSHVKGNSWHNNWSRFINFFVACQPVTTLFALFIIGWIIYSGLYRNRHKKSFKSWCKRNFAMICGASLFMICMYCWRALLFYLPNLHCN